MKKITLLFFFISLFLTACTYEKGEVPRPIAGCVNDSTIDVIEVSIGDDFFSPANIEIAEGDTVKWSYLIGGTSIHTSTCNSSTGGTSLPPGGTSWDSNLMNPGDTYKTVISVPGNYTYICVVHGTMMSGTIIVKPRCK